MKVFRKKYHPPGTAPGTFVQTPKQKQAKPLKIDMVNFNADNINYFSHIDMKQCQANYDKAMTTWIHVSGALDFDP